MKNFIIIKTKNDSYKQIIDLFKQFLGNYIDVEENEYLIINHNYENNLDIENMLNSITLELMINMKAYLSTTSKIDLEKKLAINIIDELSFGVYDLKRALLEIKAFKYSEEALDLILKSTGVSVEFILEFLKYDLNVSKASKNMNYHRNTVIYKLDKLKAESGFDLRSFQDAYILYSLINK